MIASDVYSSKISDRKWEKMTGVRLEVRQLSRRGRTRDDHEAEATV